MPLGTLANSQRYQQLIANHARLLQVRPQGVHPHLSGSAYADALIGMSIVLVLAFGFALTSEVKQIDVVVATPTHTPFVERLFTHLDESDAVGSVNLITPHKDMDEALRTAAAHVIIVLPSNIDKELLAGTEPTVQLRLDASDPNTSALISAQVQGIIYTTVQEYLEQFARLWRCVWRL